MTRKRTATGVLLNRRGGGLEARSRDDRGAERRAAADGLAPARQFPGQHQPRRRSLCRCRQRAALLALWVAATA